MFSLRELKVIFKYRAFSIKCRMELMYALMAIYTLVAAFETLVVWLVVRKTQKTKAVIPS
ncbi:MAG: hypothetical protein DRN04_13855 [Thermoprotei archaeon]|nr:MAG: hypothetical protein DRN04_13855 [Thermoprotei archaeon]